MRISSINSYNYQSNIANRVNKNQKNHQILNLQNDNINFKGKKWAVLEAVVYTAIGFVAAGPLGALVGAGAGAGIGSLMDDDASAGDDANKPYNP